MAPANPHTHTPGMSETSRCKQCHVFRVEEDLFAESEFVAWTGRSRVANQAHSAAPQTVPHAHFMREDCAACHSGAAARPDVVCKHSERLRCLQCHVGQDDAVTETVFVNEAFASTSAEE